ncbi:hypothetical protein HMPREF0573_11128 [Mobiluncus curtisii ATCC 43063]|uniref:Uncharacterized protein n=1 Tax=Mobiluncus curtisii (strain ATCC 43063 / DSM 2711 / V125) TaxID=548479 RepID=D6ZL48_MOBCV|nr:hypothetical protein HMPREF0573_11128 [Mobiluncus curtisii ATCC 43063]
MPTVQHPDSGAGVEKSRQLLSNIHYQTSGVPQFGFLAAINFEHLESGREPLRNRQPTADKSSAIVGVSPTSPPVKPPSA